MKIKTALTLLFAALFVGGVFETSGFTQTGPEKLPSAKKIISKYVKATGGEKAQKKVKTRVMKGSVEIPAAGLKGVIKVYTAAPDKSLTKTVLSGVGEIIEAFDGTKGWSSNPLQGLRDRSGPDLEQTKIISRFYRDLELKKLYEKLEVTGKGKVGDRDVFMVSAKPRGLPAETLYFDAENGLLLRNDMTLISPEGNSLVKLFFEDYKMVDGVMIAHKLRSSLPAFEIVSVFAEVRHNVPIEGSIFAKPAK
jgi:outer membrane lipoprotein-sorting protein